MSNKLWLVAEWLKDFVDTPASQPASPEYASIQPHVSTLQSASQSPSLWTVSIQSVQKANSLSDSVQLATVPELTSQQNVSLLPDPAPSH